MPIASNARSNLRSDIVGWTFVVGIELRFHFYVKGRKVRSRNPKALGADCSVYKHVMLS